MSGPALIILAAGRARRFGGIKPLAPIGPNGEAVIDLLAGDALAAGFGQIVLVVNPDTGPVIEEHVRATWPQSIEVSFATQIRPLGTVHAVLAALPVVDRDLPFAVANADDLYGREALGILAGHLSTTSANCLVGFQLSNALVGDDPVTRGICKVDGDQLVSIAERRQVTNHAGEFRSADGLEPAIIDGDALVSMNLWGFAPLMWQVFEQAMADATDASEDAEVLLPEVVGRLVAGQLPDAPAGVARVTVLATTSRCVGVTHPGDLEVVQADIAAQIERGERPPHPFDPR